MSVDRTVVITVKKLCEDHEIMQWAVVEALTQHIEFLTNATDYLPYRGTVKTRNGCILSWEHQYD